MTTQQIPFSIEPKLIREKRRKQLCNYVKQNVMSTRPTYKILHIHA